MTKLLALVFCLITPLAHAQSASPAQEMHAKLARVKSIYLRTESAVQKFDRFLDAHPGQSFDLFRTGEYLDLAALKQLSDQAEDDAAEFYQRLTQTAASAATAPADRALAQEAIAEFHGALVGTTEQEVIFRNLALAAKVSDSAANLNLANLAFPVLRGHQEFTQLAAATLPELQARGDEAALANDEVGADFASLRAMLADAPSGGMSGNITGSGFPNGTWALTYDDGPHPTYTMMDLKNLQAHGMKATFFWLAQNIPHYPAIVNAVRSAGMPTENHSYTHPNMAKLGDAALRHQIIDSTNVDIQYYGAVTTYYPAKPAFFRCPYGSGMNLPKIRQMLASEGMTHVFWNVDTLDWHDHNPASILARTQKQMNAQKHGVILFHDIHPQSVQASKMLMDLPSSRALRWVTIPQMR